MHWQQAAHLVCCGRLYLATWWAQRPGCMDVLWNLSTKRTIRGEIHGGSVSTVRRIGLRERRVCTVRLLAFSTALGGNTGDARGSRCHIRPRSAELPLGTNLG